MLCVLIRIASTSDSNECTQYNIFNMNKKNTINYPKSAAMCFFQGTQEWVRNSCGKRAISVRAIEVLLYLQTISCSTLPCLHHFFRRGNNFCDFLFASLSTLGDTLERKGFASKSNFCFFRIGSHLEGRKIEYGRVASPISVLIHHLTPKTLLP